MRPDDDELGFDEREELDPSDLVRLVGEDGEELACVLLAVLDVGGRDYAVLTPLRAAAEDDEDDEQGEELLLATYDEDADGAARFGPIDDDRVLDAVREAVKDLIDLDDDGSVAEA